MTSSNIDTRCRDDGITTADLAQRNGSRAYGAEFIGAFALVFAGCGAIAIGKLPDTGVALAFGFVIAVMIYALGHLSETTSTPSCPWGSRSGVISPGPWF
jgi:hypothetical protein